MSNLIEGEKMRTGTGTGTGTGTEIQWGWSKKVKKGEIEEEVTQGEDRWIRKKDEKGKIEEQYVGQIKQEKFCTNCIRKL